MLIRTDLGLIEAQHDAKRVAFQPVAPITATNIEDAINQVQANVTAAGVVPPTITATTVNFAQSPYTVLPTDFILEVDPTAGVVVINPQAVAVRTKPLEIKDATGQAGVNNIKLNTTIEGQTPYLIDSAYGSVTIRPNKAQTTYEVVTW